MPDCTFCSTASDDAWIFSEHAIALPHQNGITPGHALVAPRRHVAQFYELDAQEQQMVWAAVREVEGRIAEGLKVEHFHVGFSDAPEGLGHTHVHIVPYAEGDELRLPEGVQWVVE